MGGWISPPPSLIGFINGKEPPRPPPPHPMSGHIAVLCSSAAPWSLQAGVYAALQHCSTSNADTLLIFPFRIPAPSAFFNAIKYQLSTEVMLAPPHWHPAFVLVSIMWHEKNKKCWWNIELQHIMNNFALLFHYFINVMTDGQIQLLLHLILL